MLYEKEALQYHRHPRPGKIEVVPLKPCLTQADLSLAYTPGVAVPAQIQEDPDLSYEYTSRGNLIAVITNGTAVLGLATSAPWPANRSWRARAFFSSVSPTLMFSTLKSTPPSGRVHSHGESPGAHLRRREPGDIKAPDCFYIEEQLSRQMSIPVFHDDQHGTAIISAAALLNAAETTAGAWPTSGW